MAISENNTCAEDILQKAYHLLYNQPIRYDARRRKNDIQIEIQPIISILPGDLLRDGLRGSSIEEVGRCLKQLDQRKIYVLRTGTNSGAGHYQLIYSENNLWVHDSGSLKMPLTEPLTGNILDNTATNGLVCQYGTWGKGGNEYSYLFTEITRERLVILANHIALHRCETTDDIDLFMATWSDRINQDQTLYLKANDEAVTLWPGLQLSEPAQANDVVFQILVHRFITQGDNLILGQILQTIDDIDHRFANGDTLLHLAIRNNAQSSVKELLSRGAKFDVQNDDGLTPVMLLEQIRLNGQLPEPPLASMAALQTAQINHDLLHNLDINLNQCFPELFTNNNADGLNRILSHCMAKGTPCDPNQYLDNLWQTATALRLSWDTINDILKVVANYYLKTNQPSKVNALYEQAIKQNLTGTHISQLPSAGNNGSWETAMNALRPTSTINRDICQLLDSYLKNRKERTPNQYFYFSFFKFLPNSKSLAKKEDAILALKNALLGKQIINKEQLATLRNGHLGDDLRKYIKQGKANDLFDDSADIKTIRNFVKKINERTAAGASPVLGSNLVNLRSFTQ